MQFAQIFSFLMALSGFGVDANPKAATADQVLEHAVDDADLVVHLDIAAVVPRNFKALTDLPNDPAIKGSPELVKMTRDLAAQATQARAMVKTMAGFDFVTDLQSVTAFVKFKADGSDPDALVELRGNIPADLLEKISKMSGMPLEKVAGRSAIALPDHRYIGIAKSGSVLLGTDTLVKPRLADTWKAPSRTAGSRAARIAPIFDEKPFLAWALTPSPALVKMAEAKHGKNAGIEMMKDLDLAVGSLRTDGLVWATYAKSSKGFDRSSMAADGAIDLMRAFQIAPRGLAKVAVAYLDVYAGQSKEIDELIKHKADLLKLVDGYTGDGQFKATIDKDAKSRSVVVHAIGKRLSEVLPIGLILPAAAVGVFAAGHAQQSATPGQAGTVAVPPMHGSSSTGPGPGKPAPKPAKPAKPAAPAHP
jgi:hypothetical protein